MLMMLLLILLIMMMMTLILAFIVEKTKIPCDRDYGRVLLLELIAKHLRLHSLGLETEITRYANQAIEQVVRTRENSNRKYVFQ